jgi:pimeloyl-ACP methyl ester carboxylesterase
MVEPSVWREDRARSTWRTQSIAHCRACARASMALAGAAITTVIGLAAISLAGAGTASLAPGNGEQVVKVAGLNMRVFTYRPRPCGNPTLLMVFHGLNRNADRYRDYAHPLADQLCMIVVAPLFDEDRFPSWRYQRGGLVHRDVVQSPQEWTGRIALEITEWARQQEGRTLDYYMIGHSAGGQFLSRLAAFVPNSSKRIVIANPSTWVFPDLSIRAPYGLGGVYSSSGGEAELRRYLALPLTVFLGKEDTGDRDRNDSPEAVAQGETRHERGLNVYRAVEDSARARSWPLNWRLIELPGVGHSAKKMFASREALRALAQ